MQQLFTNNFSLIFFIILILNSSYMTISTSSDSLDSYIYLPDKHIQEEIAIGSLIADLSDELSNYNNQNENKKSISNENVDDEDSNENQHFTFLEDAKSSTENTYFLLDSITGRITSKRYLDRESMCMNKHCLEACEFINNSTTTGSCKMNLKILTIPSYNIINLNVVIQDINDNKPLFRIEYMNQSIPENVPLGYKIPIDLAYDPDVGINSIQSYTFQQSVIAGADSHSSRNTFELVQEESQLVLVVKQKLDREKVSQYNITITACDGGRPSNCGQLKLILNIIDINDHNPIFNKEVYTFSVRENQPVGSVIGKINAIDLDDDPVNGKISYSLISMSNTGGLVQTVKNAKQKYFDLDSETGILKLNAPLDFELDQFFSLNVEAKDHGVGSLPAYATIEINVLDVNDNSPEIGVSFLNTLHRNSSSNTNDQTNSGNVSMINVYLPENTEPNKFIAHVSIFDRDLNDNILWMVFCNERLILPTSTNQNDLLKINKLNSNSFTISTGLKSDSLFDREIMNKINVSIIAKDNNGKLLDSNLAYYNFSLVLLDENDNAPKFELDLYELTVNENNQINQVIYQFIAIDLDAGENGQISYSLEHPNNNDKVVSIEQTTGILRAAKIFDRESNDRYEFYVLARDSPKNSKLKKSTRIKCILKIEDLNDNRPMISFDSSSSPYKEFSNKTNLVLRLDENLPIRTQLIKFNCDDIDENENGQTKFILMSRQYYIQSLNPYIDEISFSKLAARQNNLDSIPFKLSEDGKFTIGKKLDREAQDFYELQIVCHDLANPLKQTRQNSSINLIIKLSDINDNCPRNLNQSDNENSLLYNSKVKYINKDSITLENMNNLILFNESYFDADIGKNAELKFDLESHLNIFKIIVTQNQQIYNLKLKFKNNTNQAVAFDFLDSMKLGKYVIKVKISDMGNPSCIKNEQFIFYLGDNQAKTQLELIELLKNKFKKSNSNKDDLLYSNYIYDDDGLNEDDNNDVKKYVVNNKVMVNSYNKKTQTAIDSLKANNYIILYCFITIVISFSMILFIIAVLVFCRRNRTNFFKKEKNAKNQNTQNSSPSSKKSSTIDLLKVKNYREIDMNNSSSNKTNSTDSSSNGSLNHNEDDLEEPNEINNLLDHHDSNNRLSSSFKNCDYEKIHKNIRQHHEPSEYGRFTTTNGKIYSTLSQSNKQLQQNQPRVYDDYSSIMKQQQQQQPSSNNNITFLTSFPQRFSKYQPASNSNQIINPQQPSPNDSTCNSSSNRLIKASTVSTASTYSTNLITPSASSPSSTSSNNGSGGELVLAASTSISVTSDHSITCDSTSSVSPIDCLNFKNNSNTILYENISQNHQKPPKYVRQYVDNNNIINNNNNNNNNGDMERERDDLYIDKNSMRKHHYLRSSAV
jgi:hypothetical protein